MEWGAVDRCGAVEEDTDAGTDADADDRDADGVDGAEAGNMVLCYPDSCNMIHCSGGMMTRMTAVADETQRQKT